MTCERGGADKHRHGNRQADKRPPSLRVDRADRCAGHGAIYHTPPIPVSVGATCPTCPHPSHPAGLSARGARPSRRSHLQLTDRCLLLLAICSDSTRPRLQDRKKIEKPCTTSSANGLHRPRAQAKGPSSKNFCVRRTSLTHEAEKAAVIAGHHQTSQRHMLSGVKSAGGGPRERLTEQFSAPAANSSSTRI